jgi:TolA-binding protein
MPPRRSEPAFDPSKALDRIARESANQMAFIEAAFDRMSGRLDSLQDAVNRGNLDRDEVRRELTEVQRQIIDTREELQRHKADQTQAAARGAAEGASSQSIQPAVNRAVAAQAGKLNRPQWYALGGVGLLWLTTFADKAPGVLRVLQGIWSGIAGAGK